MHMKEKLALFVWVGRQSCSIYPPSLKSKGIWLPASFMLKASKKGPEHMHTTQGQGAKVNAVTWWYLYYFLGGGGSELDVPQTAHPSGPLLDSPSHGRKLSTNNPLPHYHLSWRVYAKVWFNTGPIHTVTSIMWRYQLLNGNICIWWQSMVLLFQVTPLLTGYLRARP